jgi:hypothetical protein
MFSYSWLSCALVHERACLDTAYQLAAAYLIPNTFLSIISIRDQFSRNTVVWRGQKKSEPVFPVLKHKT